MKYLRSQVQAITRIRAQVLHLHALRLVDDRTDNLHPGPRKFIAQVLLRELRDVKAHLDRMLPELLAEIEEKTK